MWRGGKTSTYYLRPVQSGRGTEITDNGCDQLDTCHFDVGCPVTGLHPHTWTRRQRLRCATDSPRCWLYTVLE